MGTVRGGGIECDRCGEDCKALYGFAMSVDRVAHTYNTNVKDIVEAIDKKYGKHDFVLCWDCTVQMMGIKSKVGAKLEKARAAKDEKALSALQDEGCKPDENETLKEKGDATQKQE